MADNQNNDIASALSNIARELKEMRTSRSTSMTDDARTSRQTTNIPIPTINTMGDKLSGQLAKTSMVFGKSLTNAFDKATLGTGPVMVKTLTNVIKNVFQGKLLTAFKNLIGGAIEMLDTALGRITNIITGLLTHGFNQFLKMQKEVGKLAANLGLSREESRGLLLNMTELSNTAIEFGGTIDDISDMIENMSDVTNKNRLVDESDVRNIERLGRGTKLGVENLSKMVGEFNNLGISMSKTFKLVDKAREGAAKLGLNVSKVLTSYSTLVNGLTGFQMKSGLDNMVKLATQATQLRMELSGVAETMSQAFFEPEGAVEAAAKMQVLGGQFAEKFGDAFELMYKAQVSPEMFQKDLMDMVKGLAVKGENGLFYVPPQQMRMLQETAKVLGVQYKDLLNGAIEQGKLADKLSELSSRGILFRNDEERQAAASLIDFDSESGSYMVRLLNGKKQLLKETTEAELKNIINQKKADQDAAKRQMDFTERFKAIFAKFFNSFTQVFAEIFDKLDKSGFFEVLEEGLNKLTSTIVPAIQKFFNDKDGIGKYVTDVFAKIRHLVEKVISIFENKDGTLWQKIKEGIGELIIGTWKIVKPYLEIGFAKMLMAIGHATGFESVTNMGRQMLLDVSKENENDKLIQSLTGTDTEKKNYLSEIQKDKGSLSIRNLVDTTKGMGVGGAIGAGVGLLTGLGAAILSGGTTIPLIPGLISAGATTGAGIGGFVGYATSDNVNDAIVTSNGRVLKGAKGDIPALFDEAGLRNNMGNSGTSEIKHSGVITIKSEDGKQITISDLDRIGRYTLAQYIDSINHGLKNGTAVYNNEKMPITPIST